MEMSVTENSEAREQPPRRQRSMISVENVVDVDVYAIITVVDTSGYNILCRAVQSHHWPIESIGA